MCISGSRVEERSEHWLVRRASRSYCIQWARTWSPSRPQLQKRLENVLILKPRAPRKSPIIEKGKEKQYWGICSLCLHIGKNLGEILQKILNLWGTPVNCRVWWWHRSVDNGMIIQCEEEYAVYSSAKVEVTKASLQLSKKKKFTALCHICVCYNPRLKTDKPLCVDTEEHILSISLPVRISGKWGILITSVLERALSFLLAEGRVCWLRVWTLETTFRGFEFQLKTRNLGQGICTHLCLGFLWPNIPIKSAPATKALNGLIRVRYPLQSRLYIGEGHFSFFQLQIFMT